MGEEITVKVKTDQHVYPRAVLEREVARVQDMIQSGRFLGTSLKHPEAKIMLRKVSHAVRGLELRDGQVFATIEPLSTDEGKELSAALDLAGEHPELFEVLWGLVGMGTVQEGAVQANYHLIQIAWDFVSTEEGPGKCPHCGGESDGSVLYSAPPQTRCHACGKLWSYGTGIEILSEEEGRKRRPELYKEPTAPEEGEGGVSHVP